MERESGGRGEVEEAADGVGKEPLVRGDGRPWAGREAAVAHWSYWQRARRLWSGCGSRGGGGRLRRASQWRVKKKRKGERGRAAGKKEERKERKKEKKKKRKGKFFFSKILPP